MSEHPIDPDRAAVVVSVLQAALQALDAGLPNLARAGIEASILLLGGEIPEDPDDRIAPALR
jgi:methylmalonyl-CoA mutase cobalamin-binding subunit